MSASSPQESSSQGAISSGGEGAPGSGEGEGDWKGRAYPYPKRMCAEVSCVVFESLDFGIRETQG